MPISFTPSTCHMLGWMVIAIMLTFQPTVPVSKVTPVLCFGREASNPGLLNPKLPEFHPTGTFPTNDMKLQLPSDLVTLSEPQTTRVLL